jgi:hypothetical protein
MSPATFLFATSTSTIHEHAGDIFGCRGIAAMIWVAVNCKTAKNVGGKVNGKKRADGMEGESGDGL